jgi:hypothetical protein
MGMGMEKGMTAYEAARERTVEENKRKMEALNLRHLSAAIAVAPKTPSPMKQKRRRIIEAAVVAPSPPRRSRRLANLPEVKYAEVTALLWCSIYTVINVKEKKRFSNIQS